MEKHHGSKKGASTPLHVGSQDIDLINDMTKKLNSRFGVHHESYEIIDMLGHQAVSGTNKFFHLRGKP
jgi:hypothetical protein